MRRTASILLGIMLVLASFAGGGHATAHGASDHAPAHGGSHALMADAAAPSCCSGEVQRIAPTCHALAALSWGTFDCAPTRTASMIPFAADTLSGEGLDPEGLLDPPRG